MNELGISPPPNKPIADSMFWHIWDVWFRRITKAIPKVQTFQVTLDPASVNANSTSEQTFTVTGLTTKDIVTVNKPTHTSGLTIGNARVSAADTLAITFQNSTGGSINPPSESYFVVATRY